MQEKRHDRVVEMRLCFFSGKVGDYKMLFVATRKCRSTINGKYKMTILYTLMEFGVVRFNEMKKYIGQISYKTLSSTLKELEADQLVHREEYPQIPPKVEYSLTERGKSLIPILDGMCEWGDKNRL